MKKKYVIIVATSPKTHGGISSVVSIHKTGEHWSKYHCIWIETHRDGGYLIKILYFLKGISLFFVYIPLSSIVHIHIAAVNRKIPFVVLTKIFRKKLLLHFHFPDPTTTIYDKRLSPRFGWCIKQADLCIVLSKYWKDLLVNVYHMDKFHVVFNPCPAINWSTSFVKENVILYAGTVSSRKGTLDLIRAFALIANKYQDWKVYIAGNGKLEECKNLVAELGLSSRIVFLGWITGELKDKIFKQASIFCLPSYNEGFPMAVLDAWAYGLPVIATPVGGIRDVACDGENMLICSPGDIVSLSEKMDTLVRDTKMRERVSIASFRLASTMFNIHNISQELDDIYYNLLQKHD